MTHQAAVRRLLAVLLVSVAVTACQSNSGENQPQDQKDIRGSEQQLTPSPSAGIGLSPRQRLRVLANTITTTPADTAIDRPYTYLHTQTWARATSVISRVELRLWRHDADGSGQEVSRRLPDLPDLKHQPTSNEVKLFADAPVNRVRHPVNGLRPYLPEPLPVDPTALAAKLAPRELANEPAYPRILAAGVVNLSAHQYLNPQQRAAALRVLANIPGIQYRGDAVDAAGRAGLAFRVATDGSVSTLIIDPTTGELLAAQEHVAGSRPGLMSYVLILQRGHSGTDNGIPSMTGP